MITALAQAPTRPLGSAILAVILGSVPGVALADPARDGFIATHRCAIVERLRSIHLRGPRSTSKDRFIAVSIASSEESYVQCMYFDEDTKMHCEASSGAYGPKTKDARFVLSPLSVSALHRLGFLQDDPDGNYERTLEIGTPPGFGVAADLMLGALHDAYGARVETSLEVYAPMAVLPPDACPPPVS
ncbi:hypothetical protein G3T14_14365 [Methylobacterium sp. BTF04]|uniref:TY-Chap domain-containing protein n=1 Tax=Methylobacterium sp. BTF04 TaxID=2708300 RepID=UPI0013D02C5C|nr:hypothetical protein [Methylobacterium sp. BTF04]NEU13306.1 hypothetical protein [Methylobacterium sp. BTF04]